MGNVASMCVTGISMGMCVTGITLWVHVCDIYVCYKDLYGYVCYMDHSISIGISSTTQLLGGSSIKVTI